MAKSIYVGNLPWSTNEEELKSLFAEFDANASVKLINDRETGRSRGFGFVEMEDEGALKAIEALDGKEFGGRTLHINEAAPRRSPRSRN